VVSKTSEEHVKTRVSTTINLTLLGTGTSQGIPVIGCTCKVCQSKDPRDKRLRTAAFIEVNNVGIAIDIGPDFRQQMLVNGFSNVNAILLTHEHNDHISGIDDVRPINFLYRREIPIYGGARALLEIKRRFFYAFDPDYPYPGKPRVSANIISDQPFTINDVEIIPVPIDHGDLSIYGFRIGNVAYVTDAKRIPEEGKSLLKGLDVLILNALRFEPHETHLSIPEAIAMVEELKPARSYFTHVSHDAGNHADIDAILPPQIRVGYDGLKLTSG
jgi:phosphoribosyl 1,2-cyclic phosphate phosphodiesterase